MRTRYVFIPLEYKRGLIQFRMGMLIEKTHTYWVRGYEYGYVLPKPINQGYVYTRYATINMVQQGIAQLVPYKMEWHIYHFSSRFVTYLLFHYFLI
jgi:hypothetical protein